MKKPKNPSPAEFPLTFDHALRLAVGGREVPERFRIFRAWWKSELVRVSKTSGVLRDNTDEVVMMFKRAGVDLAWFNSMRLGIEEYKAAQQIQQRRNAANSRWEATETVPYQQKKAVKTTAPNRRPIHTAWLAGAFRMGCSPSQSRLAGLNHPSACRRHRTAPLCTFNRPTLNERAT